MSTLNVLRYSALGLGIFAGFKNDLCLKSDSKKQESERQLANELELIRQAKVEYAQLHPTKETPTSSFTKIDLENPNLDFATVILNAVESMKQ